MSVTGPASNGSDSSCQTGRRAVVSVVLLVCLAPVGAGVAVADSSPALTATASATIDDDEGPESATIELAVTNEGDEPASIRRVELFDERTNERIEASVPVGTTVEAGSSTTIELDDVALPRPGVVALRAEFLTDRGTVSERVVVESSRPELVVDAAADLADGGAWNVTVDVGNSFGEPVRRVAVGVEIDDARIENPTRVRPRIGPGESATLSFAVSETAPGRTTATIEMTYRRPDESVQNATVTESVALPASTQGDPLRFGKIEATPSPTGVTISGTVGNGADVPIERVTVGSGDAAGVDAVRPSPAAFVGSLAAGETASFETTVDISSNRTTVPVVAEYRLGDRTETVRVNVTHVGDSGVHVVRLSGVETAGSDRVQLRGDVANVAEADVTAVEVSVADVDGVDPAQPQPDLFIGAISSGSFDRFDLNAVVGPDVDAVPVDIRYVLDGVEYRNRVTVPIDDEAPGLSIEEEPNSDGTESPTPSGGGSGVLALDAPLVGGGALVGIALIGVAVVRLRRR